VDEYPARRYREEQGEICESREQAVQFMLNVLNATILSSGEDYESALEQFFPQLQAIGHLIGAESIDEVSAFLRRNSRRH
jgi:hypothetical protein